MLVPPQILPFSFGDEPVNYGESIGVQCMINKGDLPIDIRWTLNAAPIVNAEHSVTVTKLNSRTSTLNVEYLDGAHRGLYKCVASNRAGEVEYATHLDVNGSHNSDYFSLIPFFLIELPFPLSYPQMSLYDFVLLYLNFQFAILSQSN